MEVGAFLLLNGTLSTPHRYYPVAGKGTVGLRTENSAHCFYHSLREGRFCGRRGCDRTIGRNRDGCEHRQTAE
jgi:hypothetical protein